MWPIIRGRPRLNALARQPRCAMACAPGVIVIGIPIRTGGLWRQQQTVRRKNVRRPRSHEPVVERKINADHAAIKLAGQHVELIGRERLLPFDEQMPKAAGLGEWRWHPNHGPDRPAPDMAYIELELLYHRVAADLPPHVNADTVIAAGDIGELGYDTGAHILDTLGLISPQTLRYYPLDPSLYVNAYAMPPQVIFDCKPDWIVSPEVYIRNGLLKDARLPEQYQL